MIILGIYALISIVLLASAFITHIRGTNLSLPNSPTISFITIILTVFGFMNTFAYPASLRYSKSSSRFRRSLPFVLQTIQAVLTTILATLHSEGATPSPGQTCLLEKKWTDHFRAHDGSAIRRIQDALVCCGFNSVKDRAYPFPGSEASTCATMYGRQGACREPWLEAMESCSRWELGIVLCVGVFQILGLCLLSKDSSWWTVYQDGEHTYMNGRECHRPLLAAPGQHVDSANGNGSAQVYGTTTDNYSPRVEPSQIRDHNAWEDE